METKILAADLTRPVLSSCISPVRDNLITFLQFPLWFSLTAPSYLF